MRAQRTKLSYDTLNRNYLQNNTIDEEEYESSSEIFTTWLNENKNNSLVGIKL